MIFMLPAGTGRRAGAGRGCWLASTGAEVSPARPGAPTPGATGDGKGGLPMHKSITAKRVEKAVKRCWSSLDNLGFCTACGKTAHGVEPDARRYVCESCGEAAVYGAEELALMVCR
jgi:predicted RNA-binding Zn-ribbon protein involved in translation (DUF1610 family)